MKFKVLFTILNIVLFTAFLVVFFLPVTVVSPAYMAEFWRNNWFLGFFFLLSVLLVNAVFIKNWHIMTCLEREDWPALAEYLEKQVFYRKKTGQRPVRLLYESLVLLGDFEGLEKLAVLLKKEDPRRYRSMIRSFTGASILEGKFAQVSSSCTDLLADTDPDIKDAEWITFYRGLARYLDSDGIGSLQDFSPLAHRAADPLLQAISAFLCSTVLSRTEDCSAVLPRSTVEEHIATARERISTRYGKQKWYRYLEKNEACIEIVILGKLPRQASEWLFPASGVTK